MDQRRLFVHNMQSLISLQRKFSSHSLSQRSLPFQDYDSFNNSFSLPCGDSLPLLWLIQECDRLNLQRNTKIFAKAYFDFGVSQLQKINCQTAPLYLLTAMRLAIKFNQNRSISDCFSVEALSQMTDGAFQHKDFQEAELQMLTILGFKLELVTPYDYAVLFKSLIRQYHNHKAIQLKIYKLLDFAISLPHMALISPSLLYWACFLEVFQGRLRREDRQMIADVLQDQQEVKRIRQILKLAMEKVQKQQKLSENDFNTV